MSDSITPDQAYQYALQAGFSPSDAVTITAIAGAESSYQANPSGNPTHYGILQFDSATAAGAGYSTADVLDPAKAFQAAYKVFQSRGFCPWQSWSGVGCPGGNYNGAYQGYVEGAQAATGSGPGGIIPGLGSGFPILGGVNQGAGGLLGGLTGGIGDIFSGFENDVLKAGASYIMLIGGIFIVGYLMLKEVGGQSTPLSVHQRPAGGSGGGAAETPEVAAA